MNPLDQVKAIDLHDLALRLGAVREGEVNRKSEALYQRPGGEKHPSLSIFPGSNGMQAYKDHASGDSGQGAIDFWLYCNSLGKDDWKRAADELRAMYGMERPKPGANGQAAPKREKSRAEYIAERCLEDAEPAVAYLVGRGCTEALVREAIRARSVGWNTWASSEKPAGAIGHGGPGVAFICYDPASTFPVAVDVRYLDPELNGGLKTSSQGEKVGCPWVVDWRRIDRARTVYLVESAINALCVESCGIPGAAALAVRGTANAAHIDWRRLAGKQVVIAFDADPPNDRNERPGSKAMWAAYEAAVAANVAAIGVDQSSWYADGFNDAADIAAKEGLEELKHRLQQLEPWAIAGLAGKDMPAGKSRVYLPPHDFGVYWRYRVKHDFTTYVAKVEESSEDGGAEQLKFEDLCGFRLAALARVTVASATATMSGEKDAMPETLFSVSVQTARHGSTLVRRVLKDEQLHNVDHWGKFGPIFARPKFLRLVNLMERTADLGARDAINFVGLAWRDGKPVVNEGPDCYFTEPEKQCPYYNLTFPSGRRNDAKAVIDAYQSTFKSNAASLVLAWALGGHLKAFTGFWPHLTMQADKGSGKSTLIKALERSIAFTMFSRQSIQTEFRLLTSCSHTSHPVGWEELSAGRVEIIDKAVALLQETYQHTITRRGSEMTEYLLCAPVLLAGEDVPVRSLTGKVVRTDLTRRKGTPIPSTLPRFPVREWLHFLAGLSRDQVMASVDRCEEWLRKGCRAVADVNDDTGAARMVRNYAALLACWGFLCEFADVDPKQGEFPSDLRAEMNSHISDTSTDREPYVWILEMFVAELESNQYPYPAKIDLITDDAGVERPCVVLRPQQIMDHLGSSLRWREQWQSLPVKTGRVFKRQLQTAGMIHKDELDKVIGNRRWAHMTALNLDAMAALGIHLSVYAPPNEAEGEPEADAVGLFNKRRYANG